MLQLFGIGVTVYGLYNMGILYATPTIPDRVKAWWESVRNSFRGRTVINLGTGHIRATAGLVGVLSATRAATVTDGTVESRVKALEDAMGRLRIDHATFRTEINQRADAHDAALQKERDEREAGDKGLRIELVEVAAGGIIWEIIGICWIIVGTVFSGWSVELANHTALLGVAMHIVAPYLFFK